MQSSVRRLSSLARIYFHIQSGQTDNKNTVPLLSKSFLAMQKPILYSVAATSRRLKKGTKNNNGKEETMHPMRRYLTRICNDKKNDGSSVRSKTHPKTPYAALPASSLSIHKFFPGKLSGSTSSTLPNNVPWASTACRRLSIGRRGRPCTWWHGGPLRGAAP